MPLPTGYSAPLVSPLGQTPLSNIPEGGGYDASGNPYMTAFGQHVSVPMANGFPLWNQAYNLYGNPNAAAARRNQIGQPGSAGGQSFVNPIPSFSATGGGGGGLPSVGGSTPMSGASPVTFGGGTSVGGVGTSPRGIASGATGASAPTLSIDSLSNLVNQINLNAQQQANAGRVPGGQAVENQLTKNTAALAQGQLPQDVINQIQQQAAERGVSTGNDSYLHSLGLTSLQAQQMAQQNLSAADARNPGAPIFDPTSQLLTPYQAGNLQNQQNQLALEWYRAMHPGYSGGGGGGRGYGSVGGGYSDPTGGTANWFQNLIGGTPSSGSIAPPSSGGGGFGSSTYSQPGGSSYTGYNQDWSGLFGDPYANPAGTVLNDASNPGYWNIPGTQDPYDPFAQYGG